MGVTRLPGRHHDRLAGGGAACRRQLALGMDVALVADGPDDDRSEHVVPGETGGQVEVHGVDHQPLPERHPVERRAVAAADRLEPRGCEHEAGLLLELRDVDQLQHRGQPVRRGRPRRRVLLGRAAPPARAVLLGRGASRPRTHRNVRRDSRLSSFIAVCLSAAWTAPRPAALPSPPAASSPEAGRRSASHVPAGELAVHWEVAFPMAAVDR